MNGFTVRTASCDHQWRNPASAAILEKVEKLQNDHVM